MFYQHDTLKQIQTSLDAPIFWTINWSVVNVRESLRSHISTIIMEFLFKSRGAGKRQVKPSQDIDLLADQIAGNQGDGSSDDSDFRLDEKSSDEDEESDTDEDVSRVWQIWICQ